MKALDDLVRRGSVRYIGCSNVFAWQMVKANGISTQLNLERFCSAQHLYNVIKRDVEREILPACADQGMGVLCWSPLASGLLTGKYPRSESPPGGSRIAPRANVDVPRYWTDDGFKIADQVAATAKAQGKTPSQVALAWLLHDHRVTAVIIGARTVAQLEDNIVPGDWDLPDEDRHRLSNVVEFQHGYPMDWVKVIYPNTFGREEFAPRRQTLPPGYLSAGA